MRYILLIYDAETEWAAMSQEEQGKMFGEYGALTADMKKASQYIAGGALQPTATATTVRVRDGRIASTDGPFAETREQLGGFYLVDAKDLDEAIALAARIPGSRVGSIEVRPLLEIPMPAAAETAAAAAR